ncbi:hypothetical protein HYE54_03530 [Aggregatibacter actinomycetemcomitans]|uniref:hypothetical protein n=1 Tax=Aggregatibacter actinomycetemcomitans TaxID=714 RepID=UPI00197C3DAB|nr:hypothetical protein [Aggregatibacter actinomycetemcomitans]MBN6067856.1 hypothetical protein [Aggregatibacter actinomycetemcomitans]MBN6085793.1 hypothetical protein [Aggregatibacter actinomycetemcomitans]
MSFSDITKWRSEEILNRNQWEKLRDNPPSGKYVVLRHGLSFGWDVVYESKKGLTFKDAQTVYEYEVKFGRTDPRNLMIVKVED